MIFSRIEGALVLEMGNPILKLKAEDISEKMKNDSPMKAQAGDLSRLKQIMSEESQFNFQIDKMDNDHSFLTVRIEISANSSRKS
ncbi:MAG: hypothetical protein ACI8XB_001363 [Patiriisocius sp.]